MAAVHGIVIASVLLLPAAGRPEVARARPSAQDQELVAVVLDDLATYQGKDSPIDGIFSPDPLTLDPRPLPGSPVVDDVLGELEAGDWDDLGDEGRAALREAAQDLESGAGATVGRFVEGSARVPLYTGDVGALPVLGFRQAPIRASLPGYSDDRSVGIVVLSIPWSIHGCTGGYVLVRGDTGWRVRIRHFACYR